MKLYTKLTREQFNKLNEQKKLYPTLTGTFIDRLKNNNTIYTLSLYDAWDLAKLVGAVKGSNIDMMILINQFHNTKKQKL